MLQTQTYTQVLNMACLLSLAEQKRLVNDMQTFINRNQAKEDMRPYTWEELRAGIREAEEQLVRGEVYTDEEDDRLFDEFIVKELSAQVWELSYPNAPNVTETK